MEPDNAHDSVKQEPASVKSDISVSSSTLLARKRAQAEASRVKLKFAETEALLKKTTSHH
jgi:hypothetical protein